MATIVFVHGGFDGGWMQRTVSRELSIEGHEIFTPTLTGLGERSHLATSDLGIQTHIQDILNVLKFEELADIVLIAHSYGGAVACSVASLAPNRVARLILVDALLPQNGESASDLFDLG